MNVAAIRHPHAPAEAAAAGAAGAPGAPKYLIREDGVVLNYHASLACLRGMKGVDVLPQGHLDQIAAALERERMLEAALEQRNAQGAVSDDAGEGGEAAAGQAEGARVAESGVTQHGPSASGERTGRGGRKARRGGRR